MDPLFLTLTTEKKKMHTLIMVNNCRSFQGLCPPLPIPTHRQVKTSAPLGLQEKYVF